ncbi:MAG: hypothetical protein ACYCYK_11365 [Candidatus Dormibacteria bacterium]
MDDMPPSEGERVRRRDRKRVTRMIVDGGNLRRQLESLRRRAETRRPVHTDPADSSPPLKP